MIGIDLKIIEFAILRKMNSSKDYELQFNNILKKEEYRRYSTASNLSR